MSHIKTPVTPKTTTTTLPTMSGAAGTDSRLLLMNDNNNNHSPIYSMDGKIFIVAVLSFVFVIALIFLLHLYIRHILRRSLSQIPHHPAASRHIFIITSQIHANSSSLARSALAAIPTFEYSKNACAKSSTECAVCLSAVEEGEKVRLLPNCRHVFHVPCIDMWLQSHCTCPVCRAGVEGPSKAEELGGLLTDGAWSEAREESSSSPAHGDREVEDVERQ